MISAYLPVNPVPVMWHFGSNRNDHSSSMSLPDCLLGSLFVSLKQWMRTFAVRPVFDLSAPESWLRMA